MEVEEEHWPGECNHDVIHRINLFFVEFKVIHCEPPEPSGELLSITGGDFAWGDARERGIFPLFYLICRGFISTI